ncbi:MAG: transcription-repair coupling factor, partial [Spirochaetia bacterium]|nr:transcription-repair coupling factor [Spirochaetia bacterium]
IYPLNADAPVRIDFFDDEIDSIRVFDPMTQKSGDRITSCTILPAGEIVLAADETKKLASLLQSMPSKLERPEWVERVAESPHQITLLHAEGLQDLFPLVIPTAGLLEYFNTNPLIVLFEPAAVDEGMLRVRREYAALYDREKSVRACILPEKLLSPDNVPPWGDLQVLTAPLFQGAVETEEGVTAIAPLAGVRRIEGFGGRMRAVREAIGRVIAEGGSVVITSPYQAQLNRIATLFKDKPTVKSADATEAEKQTDTGPSLKIEQTIAEPPLVFYGQPGLTLIRSSQRKGFALPDFNFFLWSDNDVFGRSYRRQSRFKKAQSSPLESFLDLKEGDHVVHVNHGIGRFVKLERVKAAGRERDFLVIEYADQDKLFVPLDQISMVQKYIAPVEKPRLDSLGRASFKKVREKVAEKIEEFAEELL